MHHLKRQAVPKSWGRRWLPTRSSSQNILALTLPDRSRFLPKVEVLHAHWLDCSWHGLTDTATVEVSLSKRVQGTNLTVAHDSLRPSPSQETLPGSCQIFSQSQHHTFTGESTEHDGRIKSYQVTNESSRSRVDSVINLLTHSGSAWHQVGLQDIRVWRLIHPNSHVHP